MIVVDTTVWIDFLNGRYAPHVDRLVELFGLHEILLSELTLCEVLQGLDSDEEADAVEEYLKGFEIVEMVDETVAIASAKNYRFLRSQGVTVRKTIDLLIGTWCIENRVPILHNDRDFSLMAQHLPLEIA